MIRVRFKTFAADYRPVVFPPKYPWWCTGTNDTHATIVTYADFEDQIYTYWPEAEDIDTIDCLGVVFSARFPPPSWWTNAHNVSPIAHTLASIPFRDEEPVVCDNSGCTPKNGTK